MLAATTITGDGTFWVAGGSREKTEGELDPSIMGWIFRPENVHHI